MLNIFKSRTVISLIGLFLISGIAGIREFITPEFLPIVQGIIGLLIIFFRVNPKIEY